MATTIVLSSEEDPRDLVQAYVGECGAWIETHLKAFEAYGLYKMHKGNTSAVHGVPVLRPDGTHVVFTAGMQAHKIEIPGRYTLAYQPPYEMTCRDTRLSSITVTRLKGCGK